MAESKLVNRILNLIGHFLFWGVVFFVFCPAPLGLGAFSLTMFSQEQTLWFFLYGFGLNLLLFYAFIRVALPRIILRKWFPWLFLQNLLWLTGLVLLESLLDTWFSSWALAAKETPVRPFWEWMSTNAAVSGVILLGANFYSFTSAWFREVRSQRDLEQEKLKAELSALKHQINPHFLFNVLNSLYGLAFQNDDEPTAEGIAKLSQLMRYMLYESDDIEVNLEKEVNYLQDYLSLQRLRLDDSADIRFEVEGNTSGKSIAPMLLIPFVENAFKFGISKANASFVYIRISAGPDFIDFEVNNSVHAVNVPRDGVGGIGLENVKRRLSLLYPGRHSLTAGPEGQVYKVKLTLIS